MTTSRYFRRVGGRHNVQINLTRYWAGLQKRAIYFGVGYISWYGKQG